ncbi:hypothetical protein ABV23_RS00170 [Escherichia coli]|nr:hypothetical protein [Escherichia coli]
MPDISKLNYDEIEQYAKDIYEIYDEFKNNTTAFGSMYSRKKSLNRDRKSCLTYTQKSGEMMEIFCESFDDSEYSVGMNYLSYSKEGEVVVDLRDEKGRNKKSSINEEDVKLISEEDYFQLSTTMNMLVLNVITLYSFLRYKHEIETDFYFDLNDFEVCKGYLNGKSS